LSLLFFVGNTNLKTFFSRKPTNFFEQKKIQDLDLRKEIDRLLKKLNPKRIEVFSVRKDLDPGLKNWFDFKKFDYKFWSLEEITKISSSFFQITNLYQEFGLDRFLNILGASEIFVERDFLIIDLGTCTTVTGVHFDSKVKEKNHYTLLENLIFPGIEKQINSLKQVKALERATKIDDLNLSLRKTLEQKTLSTQQSILQGQLSFIFSLIKKYQQENYQVILTGGFSKIFLGTSKIKIQQNLFLGGYFTLENLSKNLSIER